MDQRAQRHANVGAQARQAIQPEHGRSNLQRVHAQPDTLDEVRGRHPLRRCQRFVSRQDVLEQLVHAVVIQSLHPTVHVHGPIE
jgi:hypothetical protein